MVEVRVQSEGPRPTLSIEPKQILLPTTSTPSSQIFIQITFVYKEQQRQPYTGKGITQGQTEQHIDMVGTSGPHVIFPEDNRGWGR